jgi:hypothetical protein
MAACMAAWYPAAHLSCKNGGRADRFGSVSRSGPFRRSPAPLPIFRFDHPDISFVPRGSLLELENCNAFNTGISLQMLTENDMYTANYLRIMSYFWRFLNNTSAFPTIRDVEIPNGRGAFLPSSSLMSYHVTICASKAFISVIAKNRPGLLRMYKWRCYTRDEKARIFTKQVARVRKPCVW